ncbi:MAG: hypothetical protein KAS21_10410, partial [Candidatus Aminicenantes bacterium]|nr:hypothetical protein [Candidatus Aminicenantes bacterium]
MKKSFFVILFSIAVFIIGLMVFKKDPPPNVVFIIIDTLRADHTNMGDDETGETPALKKLFKNDSAYFGSSYS